MIGARDDSIAGDPRYRGLHLRRWGGDSSPRTGGQITDGELVALAVAQAATGESSDRKFLGMIAYRLPGWFPHLPDQTQYNRRMRRLVPQITRAQLAVAELIAEGPTRLADGTLIGCADYPGCARRSHFAGEAAYGYSPSHSRFVWGMRLVVVSYPKGVPVGYELVGPKTGEARQAVVDLACGQAGAILFCDKGLWVGERPPAEVEKARIRLVIESVFANLKGQMRLDRHLAKTVGGLVQRIAQRLLALTVGCSATCSPVGRRGRSSPMTGVEPTSAL